MTLVVNTAVIGNYTQPNVGIAVPGILNPNATYMGTPVNLVPYFDGSLVSTNAGGMAKSVNFLDDGGAAPLMMNKPANGMNSAQYTLLTHLYEYFGLLLGCSMVGKEGFPSYGGNPGMYDVHKFMALDKNEVSYFIQQVGLSAASFGVSDADVAAVGMSLNKHFNVRCAPKEAIIQSEPMYQSICIDNDCDLAPNATCSAYPSVMEPQSTSPAGMSPTMMPNGTSSMMPTGTGSMMSGSAAPTYTGAASHVVGSYVAAAAAGIAAFAL